ncbi:MAG: hypothetical protein U0559_09280 [Anaerolineae bacterium]
MQIIADMKSEPRSLPLVQFALRDLFETSQAAGRVIALKLADYLKGGGIHHGPWHATPIVLSRN